MGWHGGSESCAKCMHTSSFGKLHLGTACSEYPDDALANTETELLAT